MTGPWTVEEARRALALSWLVLEGDDDHLHGLAETQHVAPDPDGALLCLADGESDVATTGCGATDIAWIPGPSDRMGAPRCPVCCDALSLPRGVGSPKNDDACRVLLGLPPVTAHLPAGETTP